MNESILALMVELTVNVSCGQWPYYLIMAWQSLNVKDSILSLNHQQVVILPL